MCVGFRACVHVCVAMFIVCSIDMPYLWIVATPSQLHYAVGLLEKH